MVSSNTRGEGPALVAPSQIVVDPNDETRAFAIDGSAVLQVDLATGNRTQLADLATFKNAETEALDIALDADNNRLLAMLEVYDRGLSYNYIAVALSGGEISEVLTATAGAGPGPELGYIGSVAIDGSGGRVLVSSEPDDGGEGEYLTSVDLVSVARTIVASSTVGSGPLLATPFAIAFTEDGDTALVLDLVDLDSESALPISRLVSIDLASLERTVVSSGGPPLVGAGTELTFPMAVADDSSSDRSLVVESYPPSIVSVANTGGERKLFSSARVGVGEPFDTPFDIEYDASNDRAVVTDMYADALISINLDNGARTLLSSEQRGQGEALYSPAGLAIGDSQAFVASNDGNEKVLSVALDSGDRTLLIDNSVVIPPGGTPAGENRKSLTGIGLDSSDNTVYIAVAYADGVGNLLNSELVSLAEGDTMLTPLALNETLKLTRNLVIDSEAGTAYIADIAADQVLKVVLADGTTTMLGPISGTIPPITAPYQRPRIFQDITLMGNESVVVDSSIKTVFAIDNDTSVRRDISSSAIGRGTPLSEPTGIAYDGTRKILLVVDPPANAVFAIEPVSGDRVIISR